MDAQPFEQRDIIKPISEIEGVRIEAVGEWGKAMVELSSRSVGLARDIGAWCENGTSSLAFGASLQSANALYAALSARCTLKHPGADIQIQTKGGSRALVLRCFHNPPHEWTLTGQPLP